MIVVGQSEKVARWLGARLETKFNPPFEAIGILDKDGKAVGGAVLNDFADRNCELTMYAPNVFQRDAYRWIADYAFRVNDCLRMTIRTRASNLYVRRLVEHHGFKMEGTLRCWYDDEDAVIYGLLREDCKFL